MGQSWRTWVPDQAAADAPALTGPGQPLLMLEADPALPIVPTALVAEMWVVGAHGGAGESTLAGLVDTWLPAEHSWPQSTLPATCVLTARTSAAGLLAAQAALRQWAAGDTPVALAGLVLLADAPGRLPGPLRELAGLVAGGAPRCWSIPWIEQWRLGELHLTRDVTRLIRDLTAITDTTRRTT
ncbi:MAG: DUF6668 family protein [Candidatus Nanopelagicales bacterium]